MGGSSRALAAVRQGCLSGPTTLSTFRTRKAAGMPDTAAGFSTLWSYYGRSAECPNRDHHRGPEGPNEDLAQCGGCGSVSYSMRPPGESFGWHADDCSLPVDHESYCKPGGIGHAPAETIRGYWPSDPRSEDFRGNH